MTLKWQSTGGIFVLPVLFSLWMETIGGISIQLIPQYPAVNQSVTLSVTGITGDIRTFTWFKGQSTNAADQILAYFPFSPTPSQTPGPQYFPQASGLPNGSLQITNVQLTDQGIYTAIVQTDTPQQASVNLTVYEKVTKPTVTASTSLPRENETVNLTCDTANAESIQWGRHGASLPSDVQQSSDNRTLTFPNINRTDTGQYYCEAENPISKLTSDPYTVTVNYGPENVSIEIPKDIIEGSSFTLECSAKSVPLPTYSWIHNGTDRNTHQNKLIITSATIEDQGNYTCVVHNSVTLHNVSTYIVLMLSDRSVSDTRNDGLSPGAIAGIAIAIILVVTLSIALIYLFVIKKSRRTPVSSNNLKPSSSSPSENGLRDAGQDGGGEPELQYSSIQFAPKPAPKKQLNEENIVYSELRLP